MATNPRMNIRDVDSAEGRESLASQMDRRGDKDGARLLRSKTKEEQIVRNRKLEPFNVPAKRK